MHVIEARNVHEALPEAIRYISMNGERRESRNGPVLVAPGPVATVYRNPMEKVEFWALRDSNPFFHLMEALWMLGGRNDVGFPTRFNSAFSQFSDDGKTYNGAYGHRWRHHFEVDQLKLIAQRLRENPDDRRQVLSMWDGRQDLLHQGTKDVPCNTHAYFTRRSTGELDMTVCCRSNDIIWGCYGSNAVHFAFLLEYVAARIGCRPGRYTHISNNWHGYLKTLLPLKELMDQAPLSGGSSRKTVPTPYEVQGLSTVPLMESDESPELFDSELRMFLDHGQVLGMQSRFLKRVAWPMMRAYDAFKDTQDPQRHKTAQVVLEDCKAEDWQIAAWAWLERRRLRADQASKEMHA